MMLSDCPYFSDPEAHVTVPSCTDYASVVQISDDGDHTFTLTFVSVQEGISERVSVDMSTYDIRNLIWCLQERLGS